MGLYLFLLLCLSNLHSYCLVAQSHQLFTTPWTAACQASLSITNSHSFLRLMSIESVMPSYHLILCHPLLLLSSIFPSIRVFSSKSALRIKWQASASVLPMNIQGWFPLGLTGLISLQSKGLWRVSSNTAVKKHQFFSAQPFFMVQLSHSYMTTRKTVALTICIFVSKVMSMLFHMVSRFIIAFPPRNKHLLISWLQ